MKTVIWLPLLLLAHFHTSQSQNIFQGIISQEAMNKYGLALEAVFGIGLRLNALLDDSSSNFVVSPISATVLVSQLLLGADGEFKKQLYDLLSLPGQTQNYTLHYYSNKNKKNQTCAVPYAHIQLQLSSLLKELEKRKPQDQYTLVQSNALFYNKDIELKKCFRTNMVLFYHSDVLPLDFNRDTSITINDWAFSHTNGLIKTILPSPPGPSTSSIFLNSIYFKAKWETPFSDFLNTDGQFNVNENKKVTTVYMQGFIEDISYGETSSYRVIGLPYRNNELSMYIILPTADNPNKYEPKKFLNNIDLSGVLSTIQRAPKRDVVVKIPKLSLSKSLRLLEPLQKYAQFKKNAIKQAKAAEETNDVSSTINRIGEAVQHFKNYTPAGISDIYLSQAAEQRNLLVSDIVQQVVLSINEEGTEAAAISAGITDYMGGSKTMVLNRPFTFFIRHEPTLATLFWGSITDPSQS